MTRLRKPRGIGRSGWRISLPAFSRLTGVGTLVTFAHHAAGLRWRICATYTLFFYYYNVIYKCHGGVETARHKPGQADAVKLLLGPSVSITVRPLYLDTKLKEYTAGLVHDITDRVFVIRRVYRVNDRCRRNRQRSHAGCGNMEAGSWSSATQAASDRSSCWTLIRTARM